jgi:hypothetical protein
MDQDRRDAAAWAKEWQIRQKNRRLLLALGLILLLAVVGFIVNFAIVQVERTTFGSVEDMRKAMQGRYAIERDFEDVIIEGDEITLTYCPSATMTEAMRRNTVTTTAVKTPCMKTTLRSGITETVL